MKYKFLLLVFAVLVLSSLVSAYYSANIKILTQASNIPANLTDYNSMNQAKLVSKGIFLFIIETVKMFSWLLLLAFILTIFLFKKAKKVKKT